MGYTAPGAPSKGKVRSTRISDTAPTLFRYDPIQIRPYSDTTLFRYAAIQIQPYSDTTLFRYIAAIQIRPLPRYTTAIQIHSRYSDTPLSRYTAVIQIRPYPDAPLFRYSHQNATLSRYTAAIQIQPPKYDLIQIHSRYLTQALAPVHDGMHGGVE